MKKILLSFILFFILCISVNKAKAKAKAQARPEFGIRGGVNFASIQGFKQETDTPRKGLLAGVYAVIHIPGSSFSVQPEVLYSQKGAVINTVEVNTSYLHIPVFMRLDFASKTFLSPHLLLGPYVAFNLTAQEKPAVQSGLPSLDERINKTAFGLAVGAGIDVKGINIGVRYNRDISKLFKIEEDGRNSVISIVAGFQF